jgi:hypothetical protein
MSKPPEPPHPAQGATLQQPNLPEEEIPTQRTPRVVMPTQQPSTSEKSDSRPVHSATADIDEIPTQRIRRIKTPTQQPSTQEKPDPRPVHSATADIDETPTQRIRRIKTPTQQPSTYEKPDPRPADSATAQTDETPTQRIPRIKTPTQQPSPHEETDERVADAAAVDAEKVDPAPDRSEDAATVEMPAAVAAVSGGRNSAADTERSDDQKLEPIAAHTEMADVAAADPDDSDSLEEQPVHHPVVGAAGEPFPWPEHQVVGPVPTRNPAGKKRLLSAGLAAIALSALLGSALFFSGREAGEVTAQSVATGTATSTMPSKPTAATSTMPSKPTSEAPTGSTDTERDESTIQVKVLAATAKPFQTVRIEGKYPSGADTYLRVQRWDEGEWLAFPIPTKTDQSGQFTAYVELGQPGRYPLRVLDPDSGTTSKTFVILIDS